MQNWTKPSPTPTIRPAPCRPSFQNQSTHSVGRSCSWSSYFREIGRMRSVAIAWKCSRAARAFSDISKSMGIEETSDQRERFEAREAARVAEMELGQVLARVAVA